MWTSWGLTIPSSEAYKWSYYPSYNIIQEAITKFLFQALCVTSWASSLRWRMPMSHSGETVLTEVRPNPQPGTARSKQKIMYRFLHTIIYQYHIYISIEIFQDINVSYHLQTPCSFGDYFLTCLSALGFIDEWLHKTLLLFSYSCLSKFLQQFASSKE